MRQVAGTLRLDLADFRELQAFAQFGSDVDKTTQQQLSRGSRLVELLKQPQYRPLPVERQVVLLFAGTKGFLDPIAVASISNYEQGLYQFMDARHSEVISRVASEKKLDDQLTADLENALKEFTEQFIATNKDAAA